MSQPPPARFHQGADQDAYHLTEKGVADDPELPMGIPVHDLDPLHTADRMLGRATRGLERREIPFSRYLAGRGAHSVEIQPVMCSRCERAEEQRWIGGLPEEVSVLPGKGRSWPPIRTHFGGAEDMNSRVLVGQNTQLNGAGRNSRIRPQHRHLMAGMNSGVGSPRTVHGNRDSQKLRVAPHQSPLDRDPIGLILPTEERCAVVLEIQAIGFFRHEAILSKRSPPYHLSAKFRSMDRMTEGKLSLLPVLL